MPDLRGKEAEDGTFRGKRGPRHLGHLRVVSSRGDPPQEVRTWYQPRPTHGPGAAAPVLQLHQAQGREREGRATLRGRSEAAGEERVKSSSSGLAPPTERHSGPVRAR